MRRGPEKERAKYSEELCGRRRDAGAQRWQGLRGMVEVIGYEAAL